MTWFTCTYGCPKKFRKTKFNFKTSKSVTIKKYIFLKNLYEFIKMLRMSEVSHMLNSINDIFLK